jgi:hypothetical protein
MISETPAGATASAATRFRISSCSRRQRVTSSDKGEHGRNRPSQTEVSLTDRLNTNRSGVTSSGSGGTGRQKEHTDSREEDERCRKPTGRRITGRRRRTAIGLAIPVGLIAIAMLAIRTLIRRIES